MPLVQSTGLGQRLGSKTIDAKDTSPERCHKISCALYRRHLSGTTDIRHVSPSNFPFYDWLNLMETYLDNGARFPEGYTGVWVDNSLIQ